MAAKKEKTIEQTEKQAENPAFKKIARCIFCAQTTEPSYTDSSALRKYLSDRARIVPKVRTNLCSKHQRKMTLAIKHARHLSLLPFVNRA